MQSMTGYGHAERSSPVVDISVDIKSVNGRYFDFKARLARDLSRLESEIRTMIQKRVRRGRVELFVEVRSRDADQLVLNDVLVERFTRFAEDLNRLGIKGQLEVKDILTVQGIVESRQDSSLEDEVVSEILGVVSLALEQMCEMRRSEGANLKAELKSRVQTLLGYLSRISLRAEGVQKYYKEKLENRISELLENSALDEKRLHQEVLYHVERSDISEEITRLGSHLERFAEYLEKSDGPVGKKLDFLCQELNREMNTVLSKAAVVELSEIAVEAKAEIERLREQVQNVE